MSGKPLTFRVTLLRRYRCANASRSWGASALGGEPKNVASGVETPLAKRLSMREKTALAHYEQ